MGAFDDLVPQTAAPEATAAGGRGAFDDLYPQMSGVGRYPALAGSYLAKGALASAGAVGDLQAWTNDLFTRHVYDPLHRLVGAGPATRAMTASANPNADPLSPTLLTDPKPAGGDWRQLAQGKFGSANLLDAGRALGVTDRPDLTPQNTGEKYLAAGSEGVGGAVPYLWMGGVNPAAIGRTAMQGAGAGLAGEAGAQALPEYAGTARAAASLAGLGLGGKAFDLGNRVVAGTPSPTIQAYRNLNMDPTLAGDVTGNTALQQLQAFASKSLFGGGRINEARERSMTQWGNALERTAGGYGGAQTAQEAGTALQTESRDWMTRWRQAQQDAEAVVSARVPGSASVDLAPVNQVLRATTTQMPGLPNVAELHTNPVFRELRAALATDAPGGTSTWADIRAWRTRVGEELQQSLLSGDGNQAAWRQLYGSLSRSLGDTAFANGAHREWQAANEVTQQGHQFVENVVGKLINARNPNANTIKAEDAYNAAMSGSRNGGTTLQGIRDEMPAAADEVAAYNLRRAGQATLQNAAGTQVSPGRLVSNLSPQRLAPEASDALFAGNPALAQRIDDMRTVGERMRGTERFVNQSNTATHLGTSEVLSGLLTAPLTIAGGLSPKTLIPQGASLVAPWLAARGTTSPLLTRFMARQAQRPGTPGSVPIGAYYPQLRGLLGM